MSYTPDEEQLDAPMVQLIYAINAVQAVCAARIRSERWVPKHKEALNDLRNDLNDLEIKLLEFMK